MTHTAAAGTTPRHRRGEALEGRRTFLPRGEGSDVIHPRLSMEVLQGRTFHPRGSGKGVVTHHRRGPKIQQIETICHRQGSLGGNKIPLLQGGVLAVIPRNHRTSHHHGGAREMTQRSLGTFLRAEERDMIQRTSKTSLPLDD